MWHFFVRLKTSVWSCERNLSPIRIISILKSICVCAWVPMTKLRGHEGNMKCRSMLTSDNTPALISHNALRYRVNQYRRVCDIKSQIMNSHCVLSFLTLVERCDIITFFRSEQAIKSTTTLSRVVTCWAGGAWDDILEEGRLTVWISWAERRFVNNILRSIVAFSLVKTDDAIWEHATG